MAPQRSSGVHASGDPFADLFVDVAPVFERPLQHRRVDAFLEVTDDVGYQTAARRIVHNLAHQRAGLAPIVVVLAQTVSGVDEFAVSLPLLHIGKAFRIGGRAALGVRRVHGIGHVLDPHEPRPCCSYAPAPEAG